MLKSIIGFSIRNKLIVGLFTVALIFVGIYQTTQLPIDAVPDITDNQVQIITIAPSHGATDIERLVTYPIEQANTNIPGIKEMRSFSRFGLSLVTIVFNDNVDVYWARQQVAERLQQVQSVIPKGIGIPEMGPVSSGLGEIYQYIVKAKEGYENKYDAIELRTIQDWIVKRQLMGVKGVAEVSSFGGKLKQFEIEVNPNTLNAYGLTINDVFDALEQNNHNTGGAYIEKGPTVLYIRSEGLLGSKEDIENIAVKKTKGNTPIFIKNIAKVSIGSATRYGAMCYNDKGEVAGAIVMMLKGANSSEVIKNVKSRIAQIQKNLPEGVVLEPFLDRTKMVNNAISTVEKNLVEGALIVIFILVFFLGNLRAGFLVASVIPLAMLFAISMMNLFGVSGNLMSLGALDFGLIVDGAVIIVESVMHQLAHKGGIKGVVKLAQREMDHEVDLAANKMMNSAVFGQLIILIVYLPIFTLQGIEGKMFKPMAQTVAFALLGAFILSITYIPMMSSLFLSKKIEHKVTISDKIMIYFEKVFLAAINIALRFKFQIITAVVGLFIFSVIVLSRMGGEFIPALEEGDFAVDTRVLTGSNLNTSIESTQKAAKILLNQFPEVEKVVTKIGSGEVPTDPMPMEASDMMVIMKDKSTWKSAKTFDEMAEKMGKALQDVPGITAGFQYPVQMRFNELMTGARQDVVCKIFGEDLDTLAYYANKLGEVLSKIKGPQDVYIEPVTGMPQVIIDYKREAIAMYGMTIVDVNRIINSAFAGQSAGLVFEGEKRFDLVVRLEKDLRRNIDDVRNLLIPTPSGKQIPLSILANVEIINGPNQIQREDAKRRIVVGFNVRTRDVQSVVNELQAAGEKNINFPVGYTISYGGSFENLNAAKQRLMIAVPVSLILIFILLFFAFNSIKHSLLIYTAIPFSAIGGILLLALRDMPFSISAGVGFIALFGVSVLNGIVLIAEFNRLKKSGKNDLQEIIIEGTKMRLRPVLMTAYVAALGFLPMAISNGAGAEVQRPLATVVIGGLLISTFLTLYVLPILYMYFEKGINLKTIKNKTFVILILIFFGGNLAFAQQKLSLDDAIQKALANNLVIKKEKLSVEYSNQMINTARSFSPTNVSTELGQINSFYFDNKFNVGQNFKLNKVYNAQKKLYQQESKAARINLSLSERELRKVISSSFYNLKFLEEKKKVLLRSDTLYKQMLIKAEQRLNMGESNVLEKNTIILQKSFIDVSLMQIEKEKDIEIQQLSYYLNEDMLPNLEQLPLKMLTVTLQDTSFFYNHPMLQLKNQLIEISRAKTEVERTSLLPEFMVNYSNMSLRNHAEETGIKRFHSVQLGLAIPLVRKNIKHKILASQLNESIAEAEFMNEKKQMENYIATYLIELQHQRQIINIFESQTLKSSQLAKDIAYTQYNNGEINYLELAMVNKNALDTELSYLDAIKNYNDIILLMNFLNDKY
ncbi:MAG: CusA/CzcA family heavy metal efflux RND transporter [Saprospiraceae bacterium]|nr:CusA/CzcA family heavy metal efflux RND transporter [Saprospiraceae bacterium]